MEQEVVDYVAARATVLAETPAAKQATQEAAKAWLESARDEAATIQLVDFLEGRPNNIDGVIAFAEGPAVAMMGAEAAAGFLAAQQARKAAGAKWCDCPACTAATEILAKFGRIEL